MLDETVDDYLENPGISCHLGFIFLLVEIQLYFLLSPYRREFTITKPDL